MKNFFSYELVPFGHSINAEFLCVRIIVKNRYIFIFSSYVPPSSYVAIYLEHM